MRIVLAVSALGLLVAGCTGGPGWTHGKLLSDGETGIAYHCGDLKGDEAEAALEKSHRLFETRYAARSFAQQVKVEQAQADGNYTQEQVIALNKETNALSAEVKAATVAQGCQFIGVLDPGSASRLPS